MAEAIVRQLEYLKDLLLRERECAKNLDLEGLHKVVEEKGSMLEAIPELSEDQLTPRLRELASDIQRENRRNAYLIWSSLNWVRDTMNFYSRQISTPAYGGGGQQLSTVNGGNLLSGKV